MYFEYVRATNCNRFSIGGNRTIIIRPEAKIQMVLGTNGSGKSSLLSICFSPLPPDPNDFDAPGEWEVHILHKGRRYELSAKYAEKASYNFIVDGEEQNRGHTITIQLELVKQHFNYTRELHQLFTGELDFTKMTPQARRDWIAKLSTVDFDFAFKQLARFKKGRTAASNVVDFLSGRLNEESTKLLNPDDVAEMKANVAELHETLDMLMREPRCDKPEISEAEINAKYALVMEDMESFMTSEYPRVPDGDEPSLDEQLAQLAIIISELNGESRVRGERLANADSKFERVKNMMTMDPKVLESQRDALQADLSAIPSKRVDIPDELLVPADEAIQALKLELAQTPDTLYPPSDLFAFTDKLTQITLKRNKVIHTLNEIVSEIQHIEKCAEISCPNCATRFKPGIEPGRLEQLHGRVNKGEEVKAEVSKEWVETEEQYNLVKIGSDALNVLVRIEEDYSTKYPGLFMYLRAQGGMSLGRGLLQYIAIYEVEVNRHIKRERIQTQLSQLNAALEQYEKDAGDFRALEEEYNSAQEAYTEVHRQLQLVKADYNALLQEVNDCRAWESHYDRANQAFERFREDLITYVHHEGDRVLEETIKKARATLGINEIALAENEMVQTLVKDLEVQLEKAKIEFEAYDKLVDVMCPKSGLIAEQLSAQLGALIGGMNQMIQRVWSYPLHIEVGDFEQNDLDYKFPIVADGIKRKDVAAGSDSLKEIVNRTFVIVSYFCLDLTDYPLYLDEPGRTFDAAHSHNLIPMIKDLTDSSRFSQIFLISHDSDTQIAFPNSQTIILDDRNINYPHIYNAHVEFA